MSTLSVNPKSIASRNRSENWSQEAKKHYKRQSNDRVATFKRLQKLKLSKVWIEASETGKAEMEENLREQVKEERIDNGSHGNASQ